MTDFSEWSHESLVQFARVAYAKLEAQADELALLRRALKSFGGVILTHFDASD
jgi:hypothetical protein